MSGRPPPCHQSEQHLAAGIWKLTQGQPQAIACKKAEGTKTNVEKSGAFFNISHHSKQVKKCIPSRGFPTSALVLPTRAAALATLLDKGTLRPYRYETEMLIEHPKQ